MTFADVLLALTARLTSLVLGAADTACAESSRNYVDGACVLQVVRNRASSGWARYDGSLDDALFQPNQHAHGCRWPVTKYHLELGWRFVVGQLKVPQWCKRALWYCGRHDGQQVCTRRGASPVGTIEHTYYARERGG